MIFEELNLYNFGIYKGSHTISLDSKDPSKPIILIGALNGAGKTTFLDALQLALYGKNAKCSNRGKLSYSAFLERNINIYAEEKAASVTIRFRQGDDSVSCQIFEIQRRWDKVSNKECKEHVSVYHNGELDTLLSDHWDDIVNDFIPQSISELFFFDGEKIEKIADPKRSAEFLKTGIEALLGLEMLSNLASNLNVIKRRKQEKQLNKIDNDELANLKNKIHLLHIEKEPLDNRLSGYSAERVNVEKEHEVLNEKILTSGADKLSLKNKFEDEILHLKNKLFEVEYSQLKLASGVLPLGLVTELINDCHKQLLIEKDAKEFNVAEVILTKHQERLYSAIVDLVADLGNQKEIKIKFDEVFNDFKKSRDYHCYLNNDTVNLDGLLDKVTEGKEDFIALINAKNDISESIAIAQQKSLTIPDFENVRHLIEEDIKLSERKSILDKSIAKTEAEISGIQEKIDSLMNRYDSILLKINAETFEKERQGQIISHIEILQNIVKDFNEQMVRENISKLENRIKSKFDQLKRKDSLIERLEINPKDFTLTLYSQGRNILSPERLSAGERQLFAISILWGLADCSGKELPTIIDTPMGRLDGEHRNRLIRDYFPQAASQVILLSTDEEIYGNYYEELLPSITQEYTIVYEDDKKSSSFRNGYLKKVV